MVYLELERLQPETVTQGVLFKHVKQVSCLCAFQARQAGQLFGYFKQVSCSGISSRSVVRVFQAGQLFGYFKQVSCLCVFRARQAGQSSV